MFPFVQMPVFVSIFFALRAMTSAPVATMQTEGIHEHLVRSWSVRRLTTPLSRARAGGARSYPVGLAWFTDLTLADPTYILPIANSAMLLATIEVRS